MTTFAYACGSGSSFATRYHTSKSETIFGKVKKTVAFIRTIEGRDKFLKLSEAVLDTGRELASSAGASSRVVGSLSTAHRSVKTGREILSILNVFNGVVPALVEQLTEIPGLLRSFKTPNESYQYGPKQKLKDQKVVDVKPDFANTAKGRLEKIMAVSHYVSSVVASSAYIAGFGFCRPLAVLKKHANVSFGPHADKVGSHFPTVMVVVHFAGVAKSATGMTLHTLAFKRLEAESKKNDKVALPDQTKYWKSMTQQSVALADSGLECVQDVLRMASKGPVDPRVRLPLALLLGMTGVTKVWIGLKDE